MSRLRTIKPGFFLDEELAACEPLARLLFAGLWTIADREGRLEDRPRRIKAEVLPYDECDIDYLLESLAGVGSIVRYEVDGGRFIAIPAWGEHQQPHYKEALSVLPPPPGAEESTYTARPVGREQRDRILKRDGGRCLSCKSKSDLTIDHVIPRSLGGDSSDDNLQVLCRRCNSAKHNRTSGQRRTDVELTLVDSSQDLPRSSCLGSCLGSCLEEEHGEQEEHLSTTAAVPAAATYPADFEEWWEVYGRRGSKADALKFWRHWTKHGGAASDLLTAARNYITDCQRRDRLICDGRTFLAKDPNRWAEWLDPQPAEIVQQRSGRAVDSTFGAIGALYRELEDQ